MDARNSGRKITAPIAELTIAFHNYDHVFGRESPPLEEGWPKAGGVRQAETDSMPDHPGSLRSPPLLKRRGLPPEYVIVIVKRSTK